MAIKWIPTLLKRFLKRKRKQVLKSTHYGVMYAVMNEDEDCLMSAIKAGAPVNSRIDLEDTSVAGDFDSKTPLHWVASRSNVHFLKLLLAAGADPDAKGTWSGRTPLLECSDNIECTRLLLGAGANVNSTDCEGNNVLHYAAATERFAFLQYRNLIRSGARVDVTNKLGESPLHKLCSYSNDATHRSKAVNSCIKKGCNVNAMDYNGRTALHLAAAHSNEQCVKILLRNGAVVDAADYDAMTPLHFASRRRGGEACVALLLNAGAEPDYTAGKHGNTAVQLAALQDNVESVALLLHYGASPTSQDGICQRSCCLRHTKSSSRDTKYSPRDTEDSPRDTEDSPLTQTASQLILSHARMTVPSLLSLCRLKIRRLAGPTRLHKLLELRQPAPFFSNSVDTVSNSDKCSNTDDSKKFLAILQTQKRTFPPIANDLEMSHNLSQEKAKRDVIPPISITSQDMLPVTLRRYLLHSDEYEQWWDIRKNYKIFAIAAAANS